MVMKIYCCFFTPLVLVLLVNGNPVAEGKVGKHVLCYFEGVSARKPQDKARFVPEDLDLNICTHVVYKLALVGEDLHVVLKNRNLEMSEEFALDLLNRTVALKERKPGLKVLLDLQDHNGILKSEAVTNSSEALANFSRNVADFIKTQGCDGINFYAQNRESFEKAVPLLHEELSRRGLILTTILSPEDPESEMKYDMSEDFSRNFDLILVGTYWRLRRPVTKIYSSTKELERVMNDYTASGIPSEKLVVAIPAFCVSMKLCDRGDNGINSSTCGDVEGLTVPRDMFMYHWEVLRKIANATEEWVVSRDEESGGQYGLSKNLLWTSFEDPVSVRAKAAVVLERNLAGIAIVNNDMEDFKGAYTENGETFPLTRAAYNAFYGES